MRVAVRQRKDPDLLVSRAGGPLSCPRQYMGGSPSSPLTSRTSSPALSCSNASTPQSIKKNVAFGHLRAPRADVAEKSDKGHNKNFARAPPFILP